MSDGQQFDYFKVDTYPGFLNVVFFETTPQNVWRVADSAKKRIEGLAISRKQTRMFPWRQDLPAQKIERTDYFQPKLFVTTGTFDVAALFLSPELEMASWVLIDELRSAGQDINFCFLPKKSCLENVEGEDFNKIFWEAYKEPTIKSGRPLPFHEGFISIIKLKIAPSFWPENLKGPKSEHGRLEEALEACWKKVEHWRQSTIVGANKRPLVALGISCGWNELICVAHADDPSKLLSLTMRLRSIYLPVEANALMVEGEDPKKAHIFSTSLTTLGHDWYFRRSAFKCLNHKETIGPPGEASISAAELIDCAEDIAIGDNGLSPDDTHVAGAKEGQELPPTYYQLGCHTYPGHEPEILNMVEELSEALGIPLGADEPFSHSSVLDVGKRDIWTPFLKVSRHGEQGDEAERAASPRKAAALVELLQVWIRYGRRGPSEESVHHAFDFFTRVVSPLKASDHNLGVKPFDYKDHVKGLPHISLMGDAIRNLLDLKEPPLSLDNRTHFSFVSGLKESMRKLQISYFYAEQILNLLNTFFWANEREALWDESVDLIPVVLALKGNIDGRAKTWWNDGDPRVRIEPWAVHSEKERQRQKSEKLRGNIKRYMEKEIHDFLHLFRAFFYSRHLSSYLTDEMPDMNLRYRGSLNQLLGIANMILDSMADVVFGPRATMAKIGDISSPSVDMYCDVIAVELNSHTFNIPSMLETIGHEVGHWFINELIRDTEDPEWRTHSWVDCRYAGNLARQESFERVQKSFKTLNQDIFLSELGDRGNDDAQRFIESTSDLIELYLLGCAGSQSDFISWVVSFFFRIVMGALPVSYQKPTDDGQDVPTVEEKLTTSTLTRSALVMCAWEAIQQVNAKNSQVAIEDLSVEAFRDRLLEKKGPMDVLRLAIATQCVLGPDLRKVQVLSTSEDWQRFLLIHVFSMPWFRSDIAFRQAVTVFVNIVNHLANTDPRSDFPGRLLPCIRDAFKDLREGTQKHMIPSLHVRQWLTNEDTKEIRTMWKEGSAPSKFENQKWRSAIQPASVFGLVEQQGEGYLEILQGVRSVLFQRGAFLVRSEEALTEVNEVRSAFYLRLLQMLPSWRVSILRRCSALAEAPTRDD